MLVPDAKDAEKCMRLRIQAKQGVILHPDDADFCETMWRKYPEWYASLSGEVFNRTVPFGSKARWTENNKGE